MSIEIKTGELFHVIDEEGTEPPVDVEFGLDGEVWISRKGSTPAEAESVTIPAIQVNAVTNLLRRIQDRERRAND